MALNRGRDTSRRELNELRHSKSSLDIPLDILFEILGNTDAIDLLNLARSSKSLRQFLMSKANAAVWKRAALNDEALPPIPADMSVPTMLSLVADDHCCHCGRRNSNSRVELFIELRTRVCQGCKPNVILCQTDLQTINTGLVDLVLQSIPTAHTNWMPGHYDDADLSNTFLLASDYASLISEYSRNCNRDQFLRSSQEEALLRQENLAEWRRWSEFIHARQSGQFHTIYEMRAREIRHKLCKEDNGGMMMKYQLGYARGEDQLRQYPGVPPIYQRMEDHPLVKVPRLLTDREWSTIKPQILLYLDNLMQHSNEKNQINAEHRRMAHALKLYRREINKLPPETLVPSFADLLNWPSVSTIITQRTEGNSWVHEDGFEHLFKTQLTPFLDTFRLRELRKLVQKMSSSSQLNNSTAIHCLEKLKLATSVFKCLSSTHQLFPAVDGRNDPVNMPLFYPEALHHLCNSVGKHDCEEFYCGDWRLRNHEDGRWQASVEDEFGKCYSRKEWTSDHLAFDDRAQNAVGEVLSACDRDPAVTTVAEMDDLDPRLVCLECNAGCEPDGERLCSVFSWRSAVQHTLERHRACPRIQWCMISLEDTVDARRLEKMEDSEGHLDRRWRCPKCKNKSDDPGRMTLADIEHHCSIFHGVYRFSELGVDYFRAVDAPPPQPKHTVRMKPKPAFERTLKTSRT